MGYMEGTRCESDQVRKGVAELRDAAIGDRDITKLEIMN
jgi:hypothetical protein